MISVTKSILECVKLVLEIGYILRTGYFHDPQTGEDCSIEKYRREAEQKYKRVKKGNLTTYIRVEV